MKMTKKKESPEIKTTKKMKTIPKMNVTQRKMSLKINTTKPILPTFNLNWSVKAGYCPIFDLVSCLCSLPMTDIS